MYEMRAPEIRVLDPTDKVEFHSDRFSWKKHPEKKDRRGYRYYLLTKMSLEAAAVP